MRPEPAGLRPARKGGLPVGSRVAGWGVSGFLTMADAIPYYLQAPSSPPAPTPAPEDAVRPSYADVAKAALGRYESGLGKEKEALAERTRTVGPKLEAAS